MQWDDTLVGRWESLPDDIKDNVVILIHASQIANGSLKAFYEQQLEIAEANDIPVMIVTATAGLKNYWTSTTDIAYDTEWLNNVMETYDCLKGFVITENYWTDYNAVATAAATHLEIAAENGGYVIWFEHQTQVIESVLQNSDFSKALGEYGDNFSFTWKNTPAGANQNAETSAYMQGLWLTGVIDQWGGLMDTWKWYEKHYGKLFQGTTSYNGSSAGGADEECRAVVMEPEALLGIEMLSIYANGGAIYSFEHPAYTQGINDENTPLFENVIYETFKYILDNPGPTKEEVLEDTKVFIHGNLSSNTDLHTGLTSDDQTLPAHSSGRYGLLPAVPSSVSIASLPNNIKIVGTDDLSVDDLNSLYTEGAYEGDAFAQYVNGKWILYNSEVNEDIDQSATVSVGGQSVKVDMEPHTYSIMETEDGSISVYLNNYRVNKDEIWEGYGSSVTRWDPDVNNLLENWLAENYMEDPADGADTYRTTTFTLTDLEKEPVVNVTRQKETDFTTTVDYDAETGTAVITVKANGYVYFTIGEESDTTVTPDKVDKSALESAINNANKKDKDDYTSSSWKALEKALEAAKAVYADTNATQTEVDTAALALNNAIAGLESSRPTTVVITKKEESKKSSSSSSTGTTAAATTPTATGDSTDIALMISLLGISAVALVGIFFKKRKA